MDYSQQQKYQIEEETRKAKEVLDAEATQARKDLADKQVAQLRYDTEKLAKQILYDAQK